LGLLNEKGLLADAVTWLTPWLYRKTGDPQR